MVTKAQGTVLTWNSVAVGEVSNLSNVGAAAGEIPIGSFADTFLVTRPGRKQLGSPVFDINLNPDSAVHAAIRADMYAGTVRTVTIVAPSGTIDTVTFTALVMGFNISADENGVWKGQITLKPKTDYVRS